MTAGAPFRRRARLAPALAGAALAAALALACGGGDDAAPAPLDTTPPTVEARPPGGASGAVVYVTLVADEIATIEYTLDGSTPATGAPGTHDGTNPLFWIRMGEGTTTLRYRAVDAAGNASAVRTETYVVALPAPAAPRLAPPP